MRIIRTCSWCESANAMPPDGEAYCGSCFHRADLPRMLCDCARCSRAPVYRASPPSREEVEEAVNLMRDRRAAT